MMFFYLVVTCVFALAGFFGFSYLQRRRASARNHNVTVQFRRSSGISSPSTISKTEGKNVSKYTLINNLLSSDVNTTNTITSPRRKVLLEATPITNGTVHNRNEARSSGVSFISPNSMYGYMPKANILSETGKSKELKKEFTIKLSPFPHMNRSMNRSPNMTINSPHSESVNSSPLSSTFLNGSIPQNHIESRPTPTVSTTSLPRTTNKRPIFSNDSSDDEVRFKKLKNQILDEIDLDDSDMFDEETASESSSAHGKKATKRPTLPFENEIHLNSPLKRVKNNEILSSYSSTSASLESRSQLNKRKFQHSPEESAANTKVKKRTYIEELELLTSDQSPYYKNIYNTSPESTQKRSSLTSADQSQPNNKLFVTTIQPIDEMSTEPDVIDLNDESDDEDDISLNTETSAPVAEDEEEIEATMSLTPQISEQVFSIKDHEYDKKKSKNRLNRFLAAVQQGSDSLTEQEKETVLVESTTSPAKLNGIVETKTTKVATTLPTLPTTPATFNFGATNGSALPSSTSTLPTVTFGSKPTTEPQGLTTTISLVKNPPANEASSHLPSISV